MSQFHVYAGAQSDVAVPEVRSIDYGDVVEALRRGFDDFRAMPSHLIFLCILYPVVGVVLARWTSGADALQLVYPLMSGFALVGPFAAVGLYEISRRRELGMPVSWRDALAVRHSPALPAIIVLGFGLVVVLVVWLLVANAIFAAIYGSDRLASLGVLIADVFTTARGWRLILVGNMVGFLFAAAVLASTVIAFPMLLDRDSGAVAAVAASLRASFANPGPVALWGLIVAAGLVVGSLPLFAGLAVVMPILGHATWHLYRALVEPGAVRVTRRS